MQLQGFGDHIALIVFRFVAAGQIHQSVIFYALHANLSVQLMSAVNNGVDNDSVGTAAEHAADKVLVNFNGVKVDISQQHQCGITSTKIVRCNANLMGVKEVDDVLQAVGI